MNLPDHLVECPHCLTANDPWDRWCDTCGQRLGPPEPEPAWPTDGRGPRFCVYPEAA